MTTATQNGLRVWGLGDWESYYDKPRRLNPRAEDVLMSPCPFNKGKLVADTHFAFVGMPEINGEPLTIAKWLKLHPVDEQPKFSYYKKTWHPGQPCTDVATLEPRLYFVLREIVPGSTYKRPEEQAAMLPPEYEVPTTIVEVTKDILVFRKTGKRCNAWRWAACSERTVQTSLIEADRVLSVGHFGVESGLSIDPWRGNRMDVVGVGACRKVEF